MEISTKERDKLADIFYEAVTGSGGTVGAGIDAVLSKLNIEVVDIPEVKE